MGSFELVARFFIRYVWHQTATLVWWHDIIDSSCCQYDDDVVRRMSNSRLRRYLHTHSWLDLLGRKQNVWTQQTFHLHGHTLQLYRYFTAYYSSWRSHGCGVRTFLLSWGLTQKRQGWLYRWMLPASGPHILSDSGQLFPPNGKSCGSIFCITSHIVLNQTFWPQLIWKFEIQQNVTI